MRAPKFKKVFPYNLTDYQSINPTNNQFIKKYDTISKSKTQDIINKSQLSYLDWKNTSLETRSEKMKNLTENLKKNIDNLAQTMALEMGKPVKQGVGEVNKCIGHINYYINNSKQYLKTREVKFEGFDNEILYKPIGPILSINPWNFPFWVPFKSIIPAMIGK